MANARNSSITVQRYGYQNHDRPALFLSAPAATEEFHSVGSLSVIRHVVQPRWQYSSSQQVADRRDRLVRVEHLRHINRLVELGNDCGWKTSGASNRTPYLADRANSTLRYLRGKLNVIVIVEDWN